MLKDAWNWICKQMKMYEEMEKDLLDDIIPVPDPMIQDYQTFPWIEIM